MHTSALLFFFTFHLQFGKVGECLVKRDIDKQYIASVQSSLPRLQSESRNVLRRDWVVQYRSAVGIGELCVVQLPSDGSCRSGG